MKKIIYLLIFCLVAVPMKLKADGPELAPKAKSAIIIEASTGDILYQKNANDQLSPASMTKIMTMLLIYEEILNGSLTWDEMVTTSENAASKGGTTIFLEIGEQMSVRDLFKGIAIASGNDAAVAMAERIAGTEAAFVNMMNDKARALGLANTNFEDATGLSDGDHYSSALDMAILARELVKYEEVLKFTSIYEDYLRKDTDRQFWLVNTNKLVRFYEGMDGLKTGSTNKAGYCLTATAKKNGMRIIAIVFGEPNADVRNAEVRRMMDFAFQQYELDTLIKADTVLKTKAVVKGKDQYVNIVPKYDVTVVNKKGAKKNTYTQQININTINAPVRKGDEVGTIDVLLGNNVIQTVPLTVSEDVKKASVLDLFKRYLLEIFVGKTD